MRDTFTEAFELAEEMVQCAGTADILNEGERQAIRL